MERAEGAYFYDVDGNKYIDYLAAYGPIITGHAHPRIHEAITEQSSKGILYGTGTTLEIDFAKKLKAAIPSLDRVRFVNSGTEAVMTTIRLHAPTLAVTKLLNLRAVTMVTLTLS